MSPLRNPDNSNTVSRSLWGFVSMLEIFGDDRHISWIRSLNICLIQVTVFLEQQDFRQRLMLPVHWMNGRHWLYTCFQTCKFFWISVFSQKHHFWESIIFFKKYRIHSNICVYSTVFWTWIWKKGKLKNIS